MRIIPPPNFVWFTSQIHPPSATVPPPLGKEGFAGEALGGAAVIFEKNFCDFCVKIHETIAVQRKWEFKKILDFLKVVRFVRFFLLYSFSDRPELQIFLCR